MADRKPGATESDTLKRVAGLALGMMTLYLAGVLLIGLGLGETPATAVRTVAITLISGVAMMVTGGLLGFLFGMPRDFAGEGRPAPTDDPEGGEPVAGAPGGRWVNNNLIEVSDWLTKIVVGLGLVQFGDISAWTAKAGLALGVAAGLPPEVAQVFGVCVMLLNFVLGFLIVYLYSRTLLTVLFASVSRQIDDALKRELGEIREQQTRELVRIKEMQAEQRDATEAVQTVVRRYTEEAGGPVSVLAMLYEPPPTGFERAETRARELLGDPAHALNGRLWGYLACALGQRYRWESTRGAGRERLDEIAEQALTAVEASVRNDATARAWLRSLWNPQDPAHHKSENDLTELWKDEAWRSRFGAVLEG